MRNPIPRKLQQEVWERDEGLCQHCFRQGSLPPHHIVPAGMGRKRVHRIENLIILCIKCHTEAHKTRKMREWCEDWGRDRYGSIIDDLKMAKWSDVL